MKEGDIVTVVDVECFVSDIKKKLTNREGIILWVGNEEDRQFKRKAKVKFLKRNGRGKEFELIMNKNDLEVKNIIRD